MIEVPAFEWWDLAHGVSVLAKPAAEVEYATARAWTRRAVEKIEAIEPLPDTPVELPATDNKSVRQVYERDAVFNGLLTQNLARLCISDWKGVKGPFSPEGAARLMEVDGMAAPFGARVLATFLQRVSEGNASGSAPNGTSEADPDTAKDAAPPA